MVRRDAGLAFIGPGPPARIALPVTVLASREAALDPTEEAAGTLGPGALAHDPQPELPAVAGDDPTEAVPVHACGFERRPPALPERVGDPGSGIHNRHASFGVLLDQRPGAQAQRDRLLREL